MAYSETYRTQLVQSPVRGNFAGAVQPDDLRWGHIVHQSRRRDQPIVALELPGKGTALDFDRATLSVSDKLKILGGHGCGADADADMGNAGIGHHLDDDFLTDSPIRKLGRLLLWHCECLYYQMVGQWVGERVHGLKQRFLNLPGPAKAEVSYR
jgi:hypothetical protein